MVGFGCGFLLALLVGVAIWLPTAKSELAILLLAAAIIGLVSARFGDAFFTKALEKLNWFW